MGEMRSKGADRFKWLQRKESVVRKRGTDKLSGPDKAVHLPGADPVTPRARVMDGAALALGTPGCGFGGAGSRLLPSALPVQS